MNLPCSSLKADFFTPMIFRISAAKQLAPRALTRGSDSFAAPVLSLRSTGIPSLLKLHWLKSAFARRPADSFI